MKSSVRMLIAVVILVAIVVVLRWPQKAKPVAAEAPLVKLDSAQVQRIAITQPGQPPVVVAKSGGEWKLEQPYPYAADAGSVSSLLDSLAGITGAEDVGSSANAATFGLDTPATVELGLANGKTVDFEFGADTPTGGNSYLRLGSTGPIKMVSSEVKSSAIKSAFLLQDKAILHYPAGQVTAIDASNNGKKLHLDYVKGAWPADQQSNVQSLLDALQDGQMTAMADATGKQAAADGLAKPATTLTLTWSGGSATLELGNKKGAAEYYARNSSGPAIFTLSDYLDTDITNLISPPKPLTVAK
ncbi:MAG: DUF4340 domain-containing protein [Terriglobales bacterium]